MEKIQNEMACESISNNENEALQSQYQVLEAEMEKMLEYKATGARVRCRQGQYEEGESSTKYFLGLEKVRFRNKTLNAIECDDNSITRDQKKILHEQAKYYHKLYSVDPGIEFKLKNNVHKTYSD